MSSDAEVLAGHRLYPTRSTQAQEDILARGRIYLTDVRAFKKLGNDGKQSKHVFENLYSFFHYFVAYFFLSGLIISCRWFRIRIRLGRADVKLGLGLAFASSACMSQASRSSRNREHTGKGLARLLRSDFFLVLDCKAYQVVIFLHCLHCVRRQGLQTPRPPRRFDPYESSKLVALIRIFFHLASSIWRKRGHGR